MNHFLTSAVREIRTLRSVGAGAGDRPGHPVAISNGRPYRNQLGTNVTRKPLDYAEMSDISSVIVS